MLWCLGYPDRAVDKLNRGTIATQELALPVSFAYVQSSRVMIHQHRGDVTTVQEQADALLALCQEYELRAFFGHGMIFQGWARMEQGQRHEGLARLREGVEAAQAAMTTPAFILGCVLLAEAYRQEEQVENGFATLAQAWDARAETDTYRAHDAELHRLRGELLLAQTRTQQKGQWV